ncbi:MAG: hypothetical protein GYA34_00060 [Chloroflexi bacterium]|nr:hypothetical protein [Chloroflexota bacterium]
MAWIIPILLNGLLCGVLINYLADTLPDYRRLVAPCCRQCHTKLDLKNYFLWPRTCPQCGQHRKTRTFIVELLFPLLTLYLWYYPNHRMSFILGLILWVYFFLVIIIDLEHRLILHSVSIVGVILGLGIGTWMHGFISTILGGVLGFLIMLVLYYFGIILFKKIKKTSDEGEQVYNGHSEDEALGFGDVNLSGVVGLLLGWPGIVAGITVTIFMAGGFSALYLIYMLFKRKYHAYMAIPYGPFIVMGAAILLFFIN